MKRYLFLTEKVRGNEAVDCGPANNNVEECMPANEEYTSGIFQVYIF